MLHRCELGDGDRMRFEPALTPFDMSVADFVGGRCNLPGTV